MNNRQDAVEGLKAVAERNNTEKQRAVATLIRATGNVELIRKLESKNRKKGE